MAKVLKSNIDGTLRGYKCKLYPTPEQAARLNRIMELSRYVYNWALNFENELYEKEKKFMYFYDLCKEFKKHRNSTPWLQEIPLTTARMAIKNAINAFNMFFEKVSNHPKFKSKKKSKKSFNSRNDRIYVKEDRIMIEGFGKHNYMLAKNHNIPFGPDIKYYNVTVSFDGDNYWLSVQTTVKRNKYQILGPEEYNEPIGIDVGVVNLVTLSTGEQYHLPDISKYDKRRKRQQRRLSVLQNKYLDIAKRTKTKYEDVPKSKNYSKRVAAVRKTYRKISNIYKNYVHNMTKEIVEMYPSAIVIEDISVRRITKQNPYLNKVVPQMMFSRIHNQLKYKAEDRGIPVVTADRYYPSSKRCNHCGNINRNLEKERTYVCPKCGYTEDRDINAALNLRDLAYIQ